MGNQHPVNSITGIGTAANVSKTDFISYVKTRTAVVMASVAETRAADLTGQTKIALRSSIFSMRAGDSTTPDDGSFCIRDANGNRFFRQNRELLTAPLVLYVRTDGSDSNDGRTNTAGGAFLTIQRALDVAATLDLGTSYVHIQLADGTYTGGAILPQLVGGVTGGVSGYIIGNAASPQNVIISTTGTHCIEVPSSSTGTVFHVRDMELRTTGSGSCLYGNGPGELQFRNIRFGACAGSHIESRFNCHVRAVGDFFTVGNAVYHYLAQYEGVVDLTGVTDTYSGTRTFTVTARANAGGMVRAEVGVQTIASGSVTATRYSVTGIGTIMHGLGANFFPGNVAGSTATGGIYF